MAENPSKDTYTPRSIDTSQIDLPAEITELTERLAENAHDIWAKDRIAQGWTYGPRSDDNKTNPCLVPYDNLSDEEKQYDRNAAMETLKAIVALGYRIERCNER